LAGTVRLVLAGPLLPPAYWKLTVTAAGLAFGLASVRYSSKVPPV